jgi:tyrosyl-tRNA synthetase
MHTDELLTRGVAEIISGPGFRERLEGGRALRLKQGFDPTKPDMHIGHAVGLRKLRAFQELGHQVVLIIGDWTAQIGDPSGRDQSRSRLSAEAVQANAASYLEQFFMVVDRARTEVRWQSEWYGSFGLEQALGLAGRFTMAQMLAHETFRRRHEAGLPVTILELMYPVLQGYDSVVVQADIEFGGTDQKFNNLAGRELMGQLGMIPQDILLVPLIPGIDGRKMSKSFGNTVDIRHEPFEMFSRVMAMPDEALPLLFETLTDLPIAEVAELREALAAGQGEPFTRKKQLGRLITAQFHSPAASASAEEAWVGRFSRQEIPDELPEHQLSAPVGIIELLVASGLAASRGEARRQIDGGGVRIDGAKVEGYDRVLSPGEGVVVQVGRRRFVRVG